MTIDIDYKDYCNFVNNLDDEDPTSCWNFALYFHNKYNFPILENECVYENYLILTDKNIELNNGVYSFYSENKTEFHHWIIEVDNNIINLFSTYGGQIGMIKISHDKNNFIKLINKIYIDTTINLIDKISYYKLLFGIKINIDKLDLSEYSFQYTFRSL